MYTTVSSVNRRKAYIAKQNKRIEKADQGVDKSVAVLARQLGEKLRERAKRYDTPPKLEQEIKSLRTRVASKQKARKLLTRVSGPRTLPTRRAALEYVSSTTTAWWVLTEQAGLDFTRTIYAKKDKAEERRAAIREANRGPVEANKPIEKEIRKLRLRWFTRKRQLADSEDDARKAELQKEIETFREEIAAKQAELQPVIKVYPPTKYSKKAAAERYIAAAQARADKAKAKAEAKKKASET